MPDFETMLDAGASELRQSGTFSTELSAGDLDEMMRQVVGQFDDEMKKNQMRADIKELDVRITNGKGEVVTRIEAAKKLGPFWKKETIRANFAFENVLEDSRPSGRLRTTKLSVQPETLYLVIRPKDYVEPYIEGTNLNESIRRVLESEMRARGARLSDLALMMTMEKLRIDAQGASY